VRRRPSADPTTRTDDWLARADQERQARDPAFRQRKAEVTQQTAAREAWRPQIEGLTHPASRGLRGTRDR
jgi:hypothetical protein